MLCHIVLVILLIHIIIISIHFVIVVLTLIPSGSIPHVCVYLHAYIHTSVSRSALFSLPYKECRHRSYSAYLQYVLHSIHYCNNTSIIKAQLAIIYNTMVHDIAYIVVYYLGKYIFIYIYIYTFMQYYYIVYNILLNTENYYYN